jgi:hypothetical protein
VAEWHKRYSRDALNGMRGLSLEERGFYNAALDLIYEEEGPITVKALKHETGFRDVRTFERLMKALAGKLVMTADGRIIDERAMFELSLMQASRDERRTTGKGGAAKKKAMKAWKEHPGQREMFGDLSPTRDEKPNEINEGGKANLGYAPAHTRGKAPIGDESKPNRQQDARLVLDCLSIEAEKANEINGTASANLGHIDSDSREESPPLVPPPSEKPRLKSKRAQPLPLDWEPPVPTDRQREIIEAWPNGTYEREIEKFTNNATEKGRTALDWDAAFRNWIINADEFRTRTGGRHDRPSGWRF